MSSEDDDRTRIVPAAASSAGKSAPPDVTDPPDLGNGLPVGTRLGEFEIVALLGEGGFGIVYLAIDHSLERNVALKEYMPSSLAARSTGVSVQVRSARHKETFDAGLRSFVNEARLLAQFDHPALVKVYRFWEANGTAYMVMPYYEGCTLKELLAGLAGPPDEAWLRDMLAPLTQALSVIHSEQCFHRDIAPDNVMMLGGSHDRPLLLDFGAARRVIGDMTQALTVILKPGYAPVEQYAEIPDMKQGAWTDVYALAAVIYFAIVGKTPPPSVGRLINDTYKPLVTAAGPGYSQQFLAAIDRALAVRPEQRTQTVSALSADLGLGQAQFDVYSTRPVPLGAETGDIASSMMPAPAPAPAPAPMTVAMASSSVPAAGDPRTAPPAAIKVRSTMPWVVVGVLVLVAGGFAAYRLLAPVPVAEPATTVATSPDMPSVLAPPVATPTVTAVAKRLDIASEFEHVVSTATPGFGVRIVAGKSPLKIDRDELSFTVQSHREGFVYVLVYGSDGALLQLYPNAGTGTLRIRAGEQLKFPRSPDVFHATDPPGAGYLLVIVSSRPRDLSELDPRPEGLFRVFGTGAEAARLVAAHKGPAAFYAGRPVCPNGQACVDEYGAAVVRVDVVK